MINEAGVPEIQKAVVILHKMSADEEMKEIARLREKTILDDESAKDYWLGQGREEIIEKMRKIGMSEDEINRVLNA